MACHYRVSRIVKEFMRPFRGIVSEKNLAAIRKRDGQYLTGTPAAEGSAHRSAPANPIGQFVFSTPETAREPHYQTRRAEDQNPHSRAESALEQAA